MFIYDELRFQENAVLKAGLLQESADYAREMFGLSFDHLSDGIISGLQIRATDSYLVLTKGIVKFNGRIYLMNEDTQLPYEHSGKQIYLRLRFTDVSMQADRARYTTEFVFSEDELGFPYEFELCRFISEEGAQLMYEEESFSKFFTEYNYVNVIHQPRSARGESSISGRITRLFATELLNKKSDNPVDLSFCFQCLQNDTIDRKLICQYLAIRGNRPYKELTNLEICDQLKLILQQNAPVMRHTSSIRERAERRMIID